MVKIKSLLFIILLMVAGGCATATDYYDAYNAAFIANEISVEQYNALMTPELLEAVIRESNSFHYGRPHYPPPIILPGPYYYPQNPVK